MYEIKYREESQLKNLENTWIKSLPKDWRYMKLSYLGEIITGNTPSKNIEKYYENGNIPWIKPDNIKEDFNITDTKEKLSKSGLNVARLVPKNSAIVCCIGTVGKVGFNKVESTTNQQINSVVFDKPQKWISKYGMYSIIASRGEHERNSYKVVVAILNKTQQGKIEMCCPSVNEQQKIANFLDIKTAQFDQIISKKEKLIEKLEEAKKSLISEVVTGKVKIFDGQLVERDASEMMESGDKWLGLIPSDWNITKIKYDTYVKGRIGWQGLNSEEFTDAGPHLVTGSDFNGNQVIWEDCYRISEKRYLEAPAIQLKNGDLLVTKDGTIGKLAIVSACPEKAVLNSGIFVTRCKNKAYITKYMYYILLSKSFDFYVGLQSTGSTIKHLYQETFVNFIYILPSVETQKVLIEFLDKQTHEIEKLVRKAHKQVRKLKQAKQSLISEAVTGKIDLRDWEIIEEGEMQ